MSAFGYYWKGAFGLESNHGLTCGLRDDDTLSCWGDNKYGQASPPEGTFKEVSAGMRHGCALRTDETLACWGYGYPISGAPPAGKFTSISAGAFDCAITPDARLICWNLPSDARTELKPPRGRFRSVSVGDKHACAKRLNGTAVCWGEVDAGAMGAITPPIGNLKSIDMRNGSEPCALKVDNTPYCWPGHLGRLVPKKVQFNVVSNGWNHGCGLKMDGQVTCWTWYKNEYGEATPPDGAFKYVQAGIYYTCAINGDDRLICWGVNKLGQSTPPRGAFKSLSMGIARGEYGKDVGFTCALRMNNTLSCWGSNGSGQSEPPTGRFSAVSAGGGFACALKIDGTVKCWGSNTYGEATPPKGKFAAISAGYAHACGLKPNGALLCWGAGIPGENTPPKGTFHEISLSSLVLDRSCAARSDGFVKCWGKVAW